MLAAMFSAQERGAAPTGEEERWEAELRVCVQSPQASHLRSSELPKIFQIITAEGKDGYPDSSLLDIPRVHCGYTCRLPGLGTNSVQPLTSWPPLPCGVGNQGPHPQPPPSNQILSHVALTTLQSS